LPLSEKTRVEVYVPDLPKPSYASLLGALEQEFTYTFGGCTILRGLSGSYLSTLGLTIQHRVNLVYTDAPFSLDENAVTLARYADQLRDAAFQALEEEAILVVAYEVHHAE
jgi:hypothetical protein